MCVLLDTVSVVNVPIESSNQLAVLAAQAFHPAGPATAVTPTTSSALSAGFAPGHLRLLPPEHCHHLFLTLGRAEIVEERVQAAAEAPYAEGQQVRLIGRVS